MDEDVLNSEKTDTENDFDTQLAELIKQSGGVVPPKKPAAQEAATQTTAEQNVQNSETTEREFAETVIADPIIPPSPAEDDMPVFNDTESVSDEPIIIAAAPVSNEGTEQQQTSPEASEESTPQKTKTDEEIEAEIDALIAEMERKAEDVASDGVSTQDDVLNGSSDDAVINTATENAHGEAAENSVSENVSGGETLSDIESEIASLERTINEAEIASLERKLSEQTRAAEEEHGLAAESYRLDYELEQMLGTFADSESPVAAPADTAEEADVIDGDKIEIVPKAEPAPPVTVAADTVEAKSETPAENLTVQNKLDVPVQKDAGSVSELEQMRARIASLEYMLAQKPQTEKTATPPPERARTAPPEPHAVGGDINSMFKQWFDLEMASKMKNLITEDDKKKAAESEKPLPYEQPAYDSESTVSDFVKLSDNVYYNVKEKKTYVMKELTASPPPLPAIEGVRRPVKKKIIKRKPAPKKKPSRLKRRAALHNRALHPRRPRRRPPGMPPRRPKI